MKKTIWIIIQIIAALVSIYLIQNPLRGLAYDLNDLIKDRSFLNIILILYKTAWILAYLAIILFFIKIEKFPSKMRTFVFLACFGTVHYQNQDSVFRNPQYVHLIGSVFWNMMFCAFPALVGMYRFKIYNNKGNEAQNTKDESILINVNL